MEYKEITPNLYTILVGDSGDGKGHAISLAGLIAQQLEVGESNINLGLYSGRLTGAVVYDLISCSKDEYYSPPLWILSDELSESIRTGDMARDFIKTMTALWEKHGVVRRERTRQHGENIIVDPSINWLGGSTLTWLRDVVDATDIDSGFFGRTIVIFAKRSAIPIYKPDTSLYPVILPFIRHKLETIWQYTGEMFISPEAASFEEEWYTERTKNPPTKPYLFPTWKRRLDTVHKFAMILQCAKGRWGEWNVIEKRTSQAAVSLYRDLLQHYEMILDSIILGRNDRKMEKCQAYLRKHQKVTKTQLMQNMSGYGIRKEELGQILNTLLEQDSVRWYNLAGSRTQIIEWVEKGGG